MTEDAVEVLTELGVDRRRVHRELFYVDEPPPEPIRGDEVPSRARPARSPSSSTAGPPR